VSRGLRGPELVEKSCSELCSLPVLARRVGNITRPAHRPHPPTVQRLSPRGGGNRCHHTSPHKSLPVTGAQSPKLHGKAGLLRPLTVMVTAAGGSKHGAEGRGSKTEEPSECC
jgi:hypothetical protein